MKPLQIEILKDTKADIWIFSSVESFYSWVQNLQHATDVIGHMFFRPAKPGIYTVNMDVEFTQADGYGSTGYAARIMESPRTITSTEGDVYPFAAWAILQYKIPTYTRL